MKAQNTVLVVEDSVLIRERLTEMLLSIQPCVNVLHAGTNREASAMLSLTRPDMVLLDISLPDKSGIDLLREIRQRDEQMAIIMVSNHASEVYQKTCGALGASQFIDKSADIECIREMLAQQLPTA